MFNDNAVTVPAGRYFLGDPSRVLTDGDWQAWLTAADPDGSRLVLHATTPSGVEVLGLSPQYGDGSYVDQDGNVYTVDGGLIGLVPHDYTPTYDGKGVRTVQFDEPATCFIDMGGEDFRQGDQHTLIFGPIRIETGDTNTTLP